VLASPTELPQCKHGDTSQGQAAAEPPAWCGCGDPQRGGSASVVACPGLLPGITRARPSLLAGPPPDVRVRCACACTGRRSPVTPQGAGGADLAPAAPSPRTRRAARPATAPPLFAVEDLLLWRNVPRSAAVLGGITVAYLLLEVGRGGPRAPLLGRPWQRRAGAGCQPWQQGARGCEQADAACAAGGGARRGLMAGGSLGRGAAQARASQVPRTPLLTQPYARPHSAHAPSGAASPCSPCSLTSAFSAPSAAPCGRSCHASWECESRVAAPGRRGAGEGAASLGLLLQGRERGG
jgi:hypothetical protein